MTEHNLFYYPYTSFTNAQLPLLKVAALYFDQLFILDPVGASWATVGADHVARDASKLLKDAGILKPLTPSDVLAAHTGAITGAIRRDMGDRAFLELCDAHGNMIPMPHLEDHPNPQAANIHWDFKDQMRQTDLGGGGTAYYDYNDSGQRARKVWMKAPGLIEDRIFLGCFEIHRSIDGIGNVTLGRETLHVMDDKQRIALVETRTQGDDPGPLQLMRYQFGNHLGSASLELDDHAQIISYEEYTPYGCSSYQAVRSQIETPKRYRFTGKERDEETGFYSHGVRLYAAWLGRWISCDPAPFLDGTNRFEYVRSNPLRLTDPLGLYSWGEFGEDLVSGVGGAVRGIAEPALVVMDFGQMGAALATHAVTGRPEDLDGQFLSATGQRIAASPTPTTTGLRAGLVLATAIPTGGGSTWIDNGVTVFDRNMSPEKAQRFLVRGAVSQVAATGLAMGLSQATGSGLTGRGPAANPAVDQAMGRNLTEARGEAGKTAEGNATFAQGRDASGNQTGVRESVPEGGQHAEPQVMSELPVYGGRTVAVDQLSCEACWPEMSGVPKGEQPGLYQGNMTGSLRVIVPRNPGNMSLSPKGVAIKAALGRVQPVMQEVLRVPFEPPLVPSQSQEYFTPAEEDFSGLTQDEIEARQYLPMGYR